MDTARCVKVSIVELNPILSEIRLINGILSTETNLLLVVNISTKVRNVFRDSLKISKNLASSSQSISLANVFLHQSGQYNTLDNQN